MTSHRTTLSILATLVVMTTAMPAFASASPLLSGYGGPGEGNQAILGSALLGGGGLSGSSGGSSGSRGSSPTGPADVRAQAGQSQGNAATAGSSERGSTTGGQSGQSAGGTSGSNDRSAGGTSRQASGGSETLGLSGEDLLYMIFALGVLSFVGVLTRRLARTTGPEGA